MDIIQDGTLWSHMIKSIEGKSGDSACSGVHFDTDGDMILCDDEQAAEIIADFLEMIGYDVATTGTYDESEPGKTWYYIDVE